MDTLVTPFPKASKILELICSLKAGKWKFNTTKMHKAESKKTHKKISCSKEAKSLFKTKNKRKNKLTFTILTEPIFLIDFWLKKLTSLTMLGTLSTFNIRWIKLNQFTAFFHQIWWKITKESSNFCGKSNELNKLSKIFGWSIKKNTQKLNKIKISDNFQRFFIVVISFAAVCPTLSTHFMGTWWSPLRALGINFGSAYKSHNHWMK